MPIHDWSGVDNEVFHDFHQSWIVELSRSLNDRLPDRYSAMLERRAWRRWPDYSELVMDSDGGATPSTARRNRIAIVHALRRLVGVVEIVSPGNKETLASHESLVESVVGFLKAGVHVLVVDLFLSSPKLHNIILDRFGRASSDLPPGMLLASYRAKGPADDDTTEAFLEPLGVGAPIPDMPAFLEPDFYVQVPLEATYSKAWDSCPKDMRYLVEHGKLPDE